MMRIVPAAALVVLCVLFGIAQAADGARESKIDACLAAAQTRDAMLACKRIVFNNCMSKPENHNPTPALVVMCTEQEGGVWRALLSAHTADLQRRDAYRAEALIAADAAWHAWAAAECAYHRTGTVDVWAESAITAWCQSDLTADRVILMALQLRGNAPY